MLFHEALGIVLDLASQNALDEQDAQENGLLEQYSIQQNALAEVLLVHSLVDQYHKRG
jgi:hypothetical protein